ncbi:DUF7933 domain-containing protein [Patulibacter defluvii]|uniref:DUF7933 domain-containing protein n=1 Tax=Patulibacter defluvii TaxID=3095358 RepID=UPI002A747444|nr:hypothetical protein [Patulibacter sp. DM4]
MLGSRLPFARRASSAALLAATAAALAAAPAVAAPGVPAPPTEIFAEGFENAPAATPQQLSDYVGAAPLAMTYTAHPNWLSAAQCNGIVLTGIASDAPTCGSNPSLRTLATALGEANGVTPATANHALAAFTAGNPGAGNVQLETVDMVPLAGAGRFLAFSVDSVAVNCGVSAPLYAFSLLNPDGATPAEQEIATGPAINGCSAPFQTVGGARVKRNFSAQGIYFSGSRVGVRLRNENGSGIGNDAAIDNLRILDATPRLDKQFLSSDVAQGGTVRLRLTVTNTSDLAEKDGWSFVDALASGLRVAATPNVAIDCRDDAGGATATGGVQVTAPAGGTSVAVEGALAQGDASCAVEVDLTADVVGEAVNGAGQISSRVGIDLPPAPATVTVHGPPTVAIDGPDAVVATGTTVPGRFHCAASAGVASCTATVTLPDGSTVALRDGDPLPTGVAGDHVITAKVVDALGQERTVTRGYRVETPVPPVVPPVVPPAPEPPTGELLITKRVLTPTLRPGRSTEVRIRVTNRTSAPLTNVRVCERVPAGLRFVSSRPAARLSGGQRCWTVKRLAPGQAVTLRYRARALNRPGRVTTRATARAAVASAQANAVVRILRAPARRGGVTG